MTNWIITEIVKAPKEKRKEYIKRCIAIANELYNLKNFHSLMAFVAAFSNTLIERLDVWKVPTFVFVESSFLYYLDDDEVETTETNIVYNDVT